MRYRAITNWLKTGVVIRVEMITPKEHERVISNAYFRLAPYFPAPKP